MAHQYSKAELKIMEDPAVSYWLKDRLKELALRDPVDSLNDLSVLIALQEEKLQQVEDKSG